MGTVTDTEEDGDDKEDVEEAAVAEDNELMKTHADVSMRMSGQETCTELLAMLLVCL